ncbi:eukaryotic translation initiation factor 3 subunit J-like [Dendronephthya gigantea]|uniref:eukaryotic translation initiation factor 3 subunit J-like n=1 Tax=Dendronephthya gigantea TaxID=151771 RepID=UPI00106A12FF|nr:eukaryotic translation initiation factor 3 subunit J-like [Dendronephthya gigantea]
MADWDDEGFEPGEIEEKKGDAWAGEDEDDDELKENWDDEEEENDKLAESQTEPKAVVVVKKKKSTVKQKILEKEEKRREEMLRKAEMREQEGEDDEDDEESIFSSLEDKLAKQKLVEESDLQVAKDLFGGDAITEGGKKTIDTFKPTSKEEFSELAKMLTEKLSEFESSVEYPGFLEVLLRDLASGMEVEDVKKLANALNALATEKQKAQKPVKGKKKGRKAVLGGSVKGTKGVDVEDYSTYRDEFDDFM